MDLAFIEPLKGLLKDPEVADKAAEAARIFFSNNSVTVNLIPAILGLLGAALFLLPLLGIPILDIIFGAMTGSSTAGYSSNAAYGAPSSGYSAPSSGYGAYSARSGEGGELTPEQEALFPELSDLRDQIEGLQANERDLRQQIYFNTAAADLGSNQISYTY